MYNKLFSKIVRSSIWLEPTPTRLVWVMFIAIMDEDGFVNLTSVANVAHEGRITMEEAEEAIRILEAPDPNSADQDFEGKRIERVPGGWIVLNANKYKDIVTREILREQTRIRVARHRAKLKGVTESNEGVTVCNDLVTPSYTYTETETKDTFAQFWSNYPRKQSKLDAQKAWRKIKPSEHSTILAGLERWKHSGDWKRDNGQFIPYPATFLNKRRWEDIPSETSGVSKIAEQMKKLYDEERTS